MYNFCSIIQDIRQNFFTNWAVEYVEIFSGELDKIRQQSGSVSG